MPKVRPGPRKRSTQPEQRAPSGVWEARLRVWIDIGGHNALGPGKVRLLETIASAKSLSAAAKQLRMSYRQAWKHLRFIEERTGLTVVEPQRGGPGGGGTGLTPQGRALLKAYRDFHDEVEQHMEDACRRHFDRWSAPSEPG